jgi:hypothetical protein
MKTLKPRYMINKAKLEGSMAEWYASEEALGFCTEYDEGVWDDKEDTTMIDELLEGNGHAQK